MGELSVDALFGAVQDFASDSAEELLSEDYEDFNASILHFLPKKAVGQAEDGSDLYEPGGVRPLNVTNADNRILASATRLLLEPVLGPLITEDQRGFIQGRSMLGNIIDVDEAMLYTAAEDMEGMAFFFDFAAAFPSPHMVWLRLIYFCVRVCLVASFCYSCFLYFRVWGSL